MLPFKLVYHDLYDLNLGAHVFPSEKFRLIHDKLLNDGIAEPDDFLRPEPATDADIRRVHTEDWVQKLKTGTLTASEQMKLEVPYSPELVHAFWLAAGGTILAAESALQDGFGCNVRGGFHHPAKPQRPPHHQTRPADTQKTNSPPPPPPAKKKSATPSHPNTLSYVGGAAPTEKNHQGAFD